MAVSINIEIDDAGAATVTVDGGEPQAFDSAADAGQYVADMLSGEAAEEAAEAGEGDEMNAATMWNEEAANRPANPNLMR